MDVMEAIFKRRSVRQFKAEPVPRGVLEKIAQAGIEAPSGCNMQLRQYVIIDDPHVMDRIRFCSKSLATAPAAIVVLVEPKPTAYGEFWMQDASAAMQNMLLAAVGLGYAACWVEGALRRCEDELRKVLGVPAELKVWSMMPVGKADQETKRPTKSEFSQVVHFNGYRGST